MMLFLENIKLALAAIRSNKMRSILTMLGIIIGISAVIAIVSIGDTMRAAIGEVYQSVGINRVVVYVGYVEDYRMSDDFTMDDMDLIKEAFGDRIEYIAPRTSRNGVMRAGNQDAKVSISLIGGNYDEVMSMNILYGRMINEMDLQAARPYVVLEQKTAQKYFGRDNVVGETIQLTVQENRDDYQIIGVYQEEQSFMAAMMMGSGQDTLYMPYSVFFAPGDTTWSLDLYVAEDIDEELMATQMKGLVSRMKNRTPEQIEYYTAKSEMGMMDGMMSTMALAVGAIAAISLVVGGIGIMNIMLVSVTERTREIGIRKALGARTKDILMQFLIESALLSAAGGIIGTLLGMGIVMLGGLLLGMTVVINPVIVVVAVVFSAIVGIFFGIYPAKQAASADPIDALRYE